MASSGVVCGSYSKHLNWLWKVTSRSVEESLGDIAAKLGQSKSSLFALPAREGYLVFVTSEDQIREVENSSIDQLSFHQAMEDVCPYYNKSFKAQSISY